MSDKKKKSSVALKMTPLILLSTLAVALIAFTLIINQDYREEVQEVEKSLEDINKIHLPPIALSLFYEDRGQVLESLKAIIKIPEIVELRVKLIDEDKDAYSLVSPNHKDMPIKERRYLGPYKKYDIIYKENSGEFKPLNMGTIHLYASLEIAKEKVNKQIFNFGIIQISQVIALGFFFFLIFQFFVAKHLKNMASYAQNLDFEDLSGPDLDLKRTLPESTDELQDLTDSFNDMKRKLEKAHKQLRSYAEDLIEIVFEKTEELNQEKNNIAKLLHNMSQAVFKINSEHKIVEPISDFTKEIFGEDIIGKNIYDVMYKEIDPKSITYSDIQSVLNICFYGDDIQWFAVSHFMPETITIIKNGEKRIINSIHDPIFNEDGNLEYLLYVVEDVTEKVQQETELHKKDEELKIMKEALDFGSKRDLSKIMIQNFKRINNSINIFKNFKDLTTDDDRKSLLIEIFRDLHTIKGSSGSLDQIRDLVHSIEEGVDGIIKGHLNFSIDFLSRLELDIFKIHGLFINYLKVINNQLKINIPVESNFLDERVSDISVFENNSDWIKDLTRLENECLYFSKLCLSINETDTYEIIKKILNILHENKLDDAFLEKPGVKNTVEELLVEIKSSLKVVLQKLIEFIESSKKSSEENIPLENFNIIKNEIWNIQKNGKLDKDLFEKICNKVNGESIFNILMSFEKQISDISIELEKKTSFNVIGEDFLIPIPKAQSLKDILVHMIRNSIDHGLEKAEDRKKSGKDEVGNLVIKYSKLENTDCSFKIELSDDGFGIDTSKIYQKAVYSGLIKNEELNHQEKLNLIFHPLLSSKDDADELSGRGIGMDAVKSLIQSIGGEIKVSSTPLKGTKFEIIIP